MQTPGVPTSSPSLIPLFVPEIRGNEWRYVKECLDTAWVSSVGGFVERFERMAAERTGVRHAVATVNGTSALHIALLVAGVQPGDEVLVSTLTFIASANAVRYCGASPVFVDAEPNYWQMDPNLVEAFLRERCKWRDGIWVNRATGRRVRAIMPVHVLGHPVQMDAIVDLAQRYDLAVVEDAAEALGAKHQGQPAGSFGDVACLSFNGNKLITTGGGGMVLTNDPQLAKRARYLTTQAKNDPTEYIHEEVGFNYRLTNVLSAIGCAQLEMLDEYIELKRARADEYKQGLDGVPGVSTLRAAPEAFCTYWMNTIRVDSKTFGMTSRTLLKELKSRGIETRSLWQPMHRSPAHRDCESVTRGVADRLYEECLNVPSSVGLLSEDVVRVCEVIAELKSHGLPGTDRKAA